MRVYLLQIVLVQVLRTFVHFLLEVDFHLESGGVVFLFFALLSCNGFFAAHFHLDFLLLDVLHSLDTVFLLHLALPSVELGGVFETHSHLRYEPVLFLLLLV